MLKMEQKSLLLPSVILALMLHLLASYSLTSFLGNSKGSINLKKKEKTSIFKVKKFQSKKNKKIKTVGIKKGKKGYSSPIELNKKVPVISTKKSRLSLNSLGANKKDSSKIKKNTLNKENSLKLSSKVFHGPYLKIRKEEQLRQRLEQKDILSKLSVPSFTSQTLRNSSLNIRFDPPEGVKEDELNTREKKFYSFTKRSYETYVYSVIRTLNNILRAKPQFKDLTRAKKQHLTGRIIFDEKGNAVSVKFIKTSSNDAIQDLFVKALVDIKILQNPPRELLDKQKNFTIYYQLMIGN